MARTPTLLSNVALQGLDLAPSQVRGAVRIVPLLRRTVRHDLRLQRREYGEDLSVVARSGAPEEAGSRYISFTPHGLVVSWSEDGSPIAAYGGHLGVRDGERIAAGPLTVRLLSRMARREPSRRLRFLPLHLAMEGFLSRYFSGPAIAWREYSRQFRTRGFQWRREAAVAGQAIPGLADALRLFEIYDDQVGVLLFVADGLASAFVVPTPEDYRLLHTSLLEDFYGELLYHYGHLYPTVSPLAVTLDAERIHDIAGLRAAIDVVRAGWAGFQSSMADDLLMRPLQAQSLYQAGPFTLQHFITDLQPAAENHIGEAIVRDDGELEYLKTYRLSAAQPRRAYLLSQLAAHEWELDATAAGLGCTREELVHRLERAGFGYLLNEQLRQQARKQARARGHHRGEPS